MYLSDLEILNQIAREKTIYVGVNEDVPYLQSQLRYGKCSLYLSLSAQHLRMKDTSIAVAAHEIDLSNPYFLDEYFTEHQEEAITIEPGTSILARSIEYVSIKDCLLGTIKSPPSLPKMGLIVNIDNGFLEAGHSNNVWFTITNISPIYHVISAGTNIAQLMFTPVTGNISEEIAPPT